MYILGITGNLHDSAVTLIRDGEVVFAIEEERLTRQKHTFLSNFPYKALPVALRHEGITIEDVEAVTFFWDSFRNFGSSVTLGLRFLKRPSADLVSHYVIRVVLASIMRLVPQKELLDTFPFHRAPRITFVEHHLAHLGSGFLISGFDEAAVCVIDGMSELYSTSLYHCRDRSIRTIGRIPFPNTLGTLYQAVTQHLGFRPVGDEYKVMGLSAFGSPHRPFKEFFEKLVILRSDGTFAVDTDYTNFHLTFGMYKALLGEKAWEHLGPPRRPDEEIEARHRDIAYALQVRLEETLTHVLRHLGRESRCRSLVLTGGVALNCVANGKVLGETDFREIYVPPAPHDSGASMGSALYHYYYGLGGRHRHELGNAFLGPGYTDEEILDALKKTGLTYRRLDDPAEEGAALLADGKIIGWFQGRMEFGPRALGNRSILADPRDPHMVARINDTVKFREPFRPFAPSVLEGHVSEYFDPPQDSPFMSKVSPIRTEKRGEVPAVTHVDGTGRLQTVAESQAPLYHRLIDAFRRRTGIPMILNTSFNVKDEPIVCTPSEAIRCFSSTGMDGLILGNCLLEKETCLAPRS